MEAVGYCSNDDHAGVDTRLPPRKRLLAGLKKQNFKNSSSPPSNFPFSSDPGTYLSGIEYLTSNLSLEQIVEESRDAALAATEVAAAARATALEKAAVAAKAAAAAKVALGAVASLEEERTFEGFRNRKNKLKKQVPVQLLYKGGRLNHENDEQLARRLHLAMNSSPRISKQCVSSNREAHSPEKLEEQRVSNESPGTGEDSSSFWGDRGDDMGEVMASTTDIGCMQMLNEKASLCTETVGGKSKTKSSVKNSKNKSQAGSVTIGRIVKIKQKKMSLTLCSIRDRDKLKGKLNSNASPEPKFKCLEGNVPLFDVNGCNEDDGSFEAVSLWKSKDFGCQFPSSSQKLLKEKLSVSGSEVEVDDHAKDLSYASNIESHEEVLEY